MITLQVWNAGRWSDAATIDLKDPSIGFRGATFLSYEMGYVVDVAAQELADETDVIDRRAVSVNYPVNFADHSIKTWPAFLLDMMPQGHARRMLAKDMSIDENARSSDLPLILRAAGTTIGNVRIKEAWAAERQRLEGIVPVGVELEEILARTDRFRDVVNRHAMLASGSSGLQGEWPKVAMTLSQDGLFYPDPFVADEDAVEHVIVKLQRGSTAEDATILEAEAAYSLLASRIGLDVLGPSTHREGVIVIPRFDRRITNDTVERYGQESMTSAVDIADFGSLAFHEDYLSKIVAVSTDPERDICEYVCRDIANLAMGNTDNHGRNTAFTKRSDGTIGLSPLFDFAPMKLSSQTIMRSTRWKCMQAVGRDHLPDWRVICETVSSLGVDEQRLVDEVVSFAARLAEVPAMARDMELPEVVEQRALAHCGAVVEAIDGSLNAGKGCTL